MNVEPVPYHIVFLHAFIKILLMRVSVMHMVRENLVFHANDCCCLFATMGHLSLLFWVSVDCSKSIWILDV
jgi:hypothetical protein